MVITEEIKKRFQECIGTTIIFCTNNEQAKIIGQLFNGRAFQTLDIPSNDIELQFTHSDEYSYQDDHDFTYFKSHNKWKDWKTITFDELMGVDRRYELW